jgi:hypothetical protein
VKKTVNRMSETKSYAGADSASLYFDNVLSVSNIPAKIVLGTGDGQRIGQEVFIKGINVKIHALCSTLKNTELYFAFIKHDEQLTGAIQDFVYSTAGGKAKFFDNSTSNCNNWRIDTHRCKVLKRGHLKLFNNTNSIKETNANRNTYIKINKRVKWNPAAAPFFRDEQYYLLMWSSIPQAGSDVISVNLDYKIYFRDF